MGDVVFTSRAQELTGPWEGRGGDPGGGGGLVGVWECSGGVYLTSERPDRRARGTARGRIINSSDCGCGALCHCRSETD